MTDQPTMSSAPEFPINATLFGNNFTWTLPPDMVFNESHRVQIISYTVLMSIASVLNLTVFFLLCHRRPYSRMTMLLMSLTVSDLFVSFCTMPLEIAWSYTVQWLADDWVCKLMMVGRIFGLYSSSFNLVAISVDRFCIIMYPFTSITSTHTRVRWMLVWVWTLSAICAVPQAAVFRKLYHPVYDTFAQCSTLGTFLPAPTLGLIYNVFVMLMLFIIPLVLFCVFYGALWFFIRKRHLMTTHIPEEDPEFLQKKRGSKSSRRAKWLSRKEPSANGYMEYNLGQSMRYTNGPSVYNRAKSKSSKMAITLVIVFVVCWMPYYFVSIWSWFDEKINESLDPRIQRTLFTFAVSQSCLNPIVTGVFSLRMDKKLERLYCWRKTFGSLRQNRQLNNRNGHDLHLATAATCFGNRLSVRQNQSASRTRAV